MEFSQGDHIQLKVAGEQSPGPEFPSVWEVPIVWNASSSAMIVIIVVRLQVQITVVIYFSYHMFGCGIYFLHSEI
jgi:hypothetical protein